MKGNEQAIGGIKNAYGGLSVKKEDGVCYWSIENYNGHHWEEIPVYLYDCLVKYAKGDE